MKKVVLVLLIMCLAFCCLFACNDKDTSFRLTFDTNGGGENTVIEITSDTSEINLPETPSKDGYTFGGWYFDKDKWTSPLSVKVILETGLTADTTVYARWIVKAIDPVVDTKYSVSYDTDGGTAVSTAADISEVAEAPVTSKSGYSFLGWFASKTDTEKVTFPLTLTKDATLFAKWSPVTYSVTYNTNGGTYDGNPATFTIESDEAVLLDSSRTGYDFKGWYTDSNYSTAITKIESGTVGNLHLFAKWQVQQYKISYYLDGAPYMKDGKAVEFVFDYGSDINLSVANVTRTGYSFSGWDATPAIMPANNITVNGTMTANRYTVYYYVDDVLFDSDEVAYGADIVYIGGPQNDNKVFSGWTYTGGVLPTVMPASDLYIYGTNTDTYRVIYILDGEEYQRVPYVAGASVTALNNPEEDGYTFSGWDNLPQAMPKHNVEVVGSMVPNVYKLFFDVGDGATLIGTPQVGGLDVDYMEVEFASDFMYKLTTIYGERFAYDFDVWTLNDEALDMDSWTNVGNLTVTAAWTEKCTEGITFALASGEYTVTNYSGQSADVYVPSTHNGLPVTSISDIAFMNNAVIESITVHNGVRKLGARSFMNCTALATVNLPQSIYNLEADTFNGCTALQSVTIPAGITVIDNAPFRNCTSLAEIKVAEENLYYKSVDGVLYSADGTNLIQFPIGKTDTAFVVPNGVVTIGNYAFSTCTALETITVNSGVASIGSFAFANTQIEEIVLPVSVNWIGSNAFDKCSKLQTITLPFVGNSKAKAGTVEGLFGYIFSTTPYTDSVAAYQWYDDTHYVTYYLPAALTTIIVSDTSEVPYGAFSNCDGIESVTLKTTKIIGKKAFYGCSSLVTVNLPQSLCKIDKAAFDTCASLAAITLSAAISYVDESAFYNTETVVSYASSTGAEDGYDYVIDEVNGTSYAYLTAYSGTVYETMQVPATVNNTQVVSIGNTYAGISGIKSILLPDCLTQIDRNAFANCGNVVVYCTGTSKPADWIDKWDDAAYYWKTDCYTETPYQYVLVNNKAKITRYLGNNSDSVVIPSKIGGVDVVAIGKYAFADCQSLQSIKIPATVTSIADGAFINCGSLAKFILIPGNTAYSTDINGVLYNANKTELVCYTIGAAATNFSLSATVTGIRAQAFVNAKNLTSISFTAAVKSVGAGAFSGCTALQSVSGLATTSIGLVDEKVFAECSSLSTIELPAGIKSIGAKAFAGCTNLTTVNESAFLDLSRFALTVIGENAFENCASIANIALPNALKRIGGKAFSNCAALSSITVPDGVTYVGNMAFADCAALKYAVLSKNLTNVESGMFVGCNQLVSLTLPFVGSSVFEADSAEAVLGYLFEYSNNEQNGYTKQYYADGGFAYYYIPSTLVEVTLTSATQVAYGAFNNCDKLVSIELCDTIMSIGESVFGGCSALETLSVPFIGANRSAEGADALFGYFFDKASTGTTQNYSDTASETFAMPSTLTELSVTSADSLGYGALYNVNTLTDIVIGDSVVNIGQYALFGCNNLINLSVPFVGSSRLADRTADAVLGYLFGVYDARTSDITEYTTQSYSESGMGVYYIPASLTSVTVTDTEALPYGAFYGLGVTDVTLSDGLETIGAQAFRGSAITSVTMPTTMETIGAYAFYMCNELANISLGNVKYIGESAFGQLRKVKSVTIPDTVIEIGNKAFQANTALETVTISELNSGLKSLGAYAFAGTALKSIRLPNALTYIGEGAISDCSELVTVSLPYIGQTPASSGDESGLLGYVFKMEDGNTSTTLKEITQTVGEDTFTYYLPPKLSSLIITNATSLGDGALSGIFNLTLTLNNGLLTIGNGAFKAAELVSLTVPATVTEIKDYAFADTTALATVTFATGSALKTIGDYAFSAATELKSIAIPAKVETIGAYAFNTQNYKLTTVTFAAGSALKTIGDYAFAENTGITALTLPKSLQSIGEGAFKACGSLVELTIESGSALTTISDNAFEATAIETLVLPKMLKTIGAYAFADSSLTNLTFETGCVLDAIGDYAFSGSSLSGLILPSYIWNIGINPFYDTPVAYLSISGYTSGYKVVDNVLFAKDGSALVAYPSTLTATAYVVPDGVVSIAAGAMQGNTHLESVSLPQSLESIGFAAFKDCTKLSEVVLRGNSKLKNIGESAFENDGALTTFALPDSLETIGDSAFKCASLPSQDLSQSALISIGNNAFEQATLTSLSFPSTLTTIGEAAFLASTATDIDISETAVTVLPKEVFKDAAALKSGATLVPLCLEEIAESAFEGCTMLKTLDLSVIGLSVATIGDRAFASSGLVNIYFGESVTSFGADILKDTLSLDALMLPFIGASLTAEDEQAKLSYLFGAQPTQIKNLIILNTTASIAIADNEFAGITSLERIILRVDNLVSVGEAILSGCNNIMKISVPYIGASATAVGKDALIGYYFGFSDVETAQTVKQEYADGLFAYAFIPSTLETVETFVANGYGSLSNVTSLTTLSVHGGDTLGKNLVKGCSSLRTLIVPFVGASLTATGADSALSYLIGSEIASLKTLSVERGNVISSYTFDVGSTLTSVSIDECVSIEEGAFAVLEDIESLYLPFVGASSDATGRNALLGYLFGLSDSASAGTVEQYYSETEKAYSPIPTSLVSLSVCNAESVNIGYGALSNTALQSVSFEGDVNIGTNAFAGCAALNAIAYDNGLLLSVGDYAFSGTAFESVTIAATVTSIGAHAFENCASLTSVTIEQGSALESVGDFAFAGCIVLETIVLPEGVISIGNYAFKDCDVLTSAVIPSSVQSMGIAIFDGNGNLSALSLPFVGTTTSTSTVLGAMFDESAIDNSAVPSALTTLTVSAATELAANALLGTAISTLTLAEGIESIGAKAVYNTAVTALTLPASIQTISDQAFGANTELTTVAFANNSELSSLGNGVFEGAVRLESATLPNSLQTVGTGVFKNCMLNVKLSVPFVGASRTAVGAEAVLGYFFGESATGTAQRYSDADSDIKTFAIPTFMTTVFVTDARTIGYGAFYNCSSLTKISINKEVESIGQNAFYGCTKLDDLSVPFAGAGANAMAAQAAVSYVFGADSAALASVKSLTVTNATKLVAGAFDGLVGLTDVVLNDGIVSIESGIFKDCLALQNMTVPYLGSKLNPDKPQDAILGYWFDASTVDDTAATAQVYGAGQVAYALLPTDLRTITLTSAGKIGYGALSYVKTLTNVVVNKEVSEIGQNAFSGCTNLQSLTVPFVGASKTAAGQTARLSYVAGTLSSLKTIIVTNATQIGANAFSGNSYITTVSLNEGITEIGASAFGTAVSLATITIPSTVLTIGAGAFDGCAALVTIGFAEGSVLQTLGSKAFANTAIISLSVPSTVTSIGGELLLGCDSLESLSLPFIGAAADAEGDEAILGYLFGFVSSATSGRVAQYYDETSLHYTLLPDNFKSLTLTNAKTIGYGALYNVKSLTSFAVNDGLTSIGRFAFAYCTGLTSLAFADSVNTIGMAAFIGCSALNDITLPFVGMTREAVGVTGMFGYVFGEVSNSAQGATVQYYSATLSRTFFIPTALHSVTITSASRVNYGAFYNCSALTSITLNEGISEINGKVFYNCSGIKELVLPTTVVSVADGAFEGMTSLVSITLPAALCADEASYDGKLKAIAYMFGETTGYAENVVKYDYTDGGVSQTKYFCVPFSLRYIVNNI